LAVLEPTTLPSARSISPCAAAIADTSISGADVPSPTTRAPTRIGDRPSAADTRDAASTKRSADRMSRAKPATRKRRDTITRTTVPAGPTPSASYPVNRPSILHFS
jgi:hypothetical protein